MSDLNIYPLHELPGWSEERLCEAHQQGFTHALAATDVTTGETAMVLMQSDIDPYGAPLETAFQPKARVPSKFKRVLGFIGLS